MQLIIRNSVREAATRDLRRANIGKIQVAPSIGGSRLPPRRSRKVSIEALDMDDRRLVLEMMSVGVLRVFESMPFQELSVEEFKGLAITELTDEVPVEEPAPVEVPSEEPAEEAAEEAAPPEDPAPEEAPEEPVTEPELETPKHSESDLKKIKNADLRSMLSSMTRGEQTGEGLRKAELVEAILEVQG